MTDEQVGQIAEALMRLVHGRLIGHPGEHLEPTGFEALTMALVGNGRPGDGGTIYDGLYAIANGLNEVADAIRETGRAGQ